MKLFPPSLVSLSLEFCSFGTYDGLEDLTHLSKLIVYDCNLTDDAIQKLTKNISTLVAVGNPELTDKAITSLSSYKLKYLQFGCCLKMTQVPLSL